ncbi:hypothetical protein A2833_03165 [Candidatus Azambacteria bacterium RIFCSPHIGHO2_01_FULL_44_55]|uniref:Uncharacterized protein n=1 Tax=Candidatus Azambacteria bacterium RIFCSPLOWO2_02_FULL_44_14 TaxID=1797306 RepID=A0A1F5CBF5_9BACT|nr:MAG: hypothetical protein A3A18_02480 [Candidatus Azambacteria bacterium RIFCSPLOWO2_01_FULL_44_84]OGD32730.1 MAG: hypothetical protein A3C78_01895 [Candidatus Azambacteria bacterium RIFCSPHIGHO2_02_FULL_45_18]OGD40183.1 MAG: hypothetical protein A3I30_02860 [Candidatus Azambacteria bacterium RIFCSPLOWO2_02_FULL_44_14]OGD41715.1 MAG: hypothetical protein A2833_03165 [Candidatus Azambacteria bacterium RIFCSPHIGHO2_01_FULL_44_55]OGD50066.1 MAG: hypothetical protein A2608_03390 [Candidatus Azam
MEKNKFTNLINSLSAIAEKDLWMPRYDKELDYFFWTRESVSKRAKLIQVSHEASLYVSPKGKIEGVLVEYLQSNFVEHNPTYKDFVKSFTKRIDDSVYTIKDTDNENKYLFAFGEALRADIYQDAKEIGKGKLDLDDLAKYAFAKS